MTYVVETVDIYGLQLLLVFEAEELLQAYQLYSMLRRGTVGAIYTLDTSYEYACAIVNDWNCNEK